MLGTELEEPRQCRNYRSDREPDIHQVTFAIPAYDLTQKTHTHHDNTDAGKLVLEVIEGMNLQPVRQIQRVVDESLV